MRAWADAWWEARQWQYQERPEVSAQIELLRAGDARQQALTRDITETGQREPWVMEDPAEWRDFFREVFGRDMPRNAEHEARLHQLDAADLLTAEMWTNGPDGTSYLHGWNADELAAERGGVSFPHLYQQRYLQLSAAGQPLQGALEETPGPKVSKAAVAAAEVRDENAAALTQHEAVGSTARAEQRHDVASAAAKTPDLSDLPPEPKVPSRESVDEWSMKSMGGYLDAGTRHDAWMHAARAGQLQKSGGSHQDIMQALAAAEMAAPAGKDREFHAKRLDAYAQAHGLKGFYRYESPLGGGRHMVQVNKIRTPEEGDHGRYYASDPFRKGSPQIIDRDTGRIVGNAPDAKAARARIVELEARTPSVPNTVVHQPDPTAPLAPAPGCGQVMPYGTRRACHRRGQGTQRGHGTGHFPRPA